VATRHHKKRRAWRTIVFALVTLVVLVALATPWVLSLPPFGGELSGERLARARANPLYHDGAFANPLPPAAYTWDDVRNLFNGQFFGDEVREPPAPIPVVQVAPASLRDAPPNPGLRAFWIGHASVYVEIDGKRLLIDPVFSDLGTCPPSPPRPRPVRARATPAPARCRASPP
jgi:hypothetical protein